MKGVFTTRIDPSYDDLPESRYHFPHTYLKQVQNTIGDLIVYYEPGRTGRDSNSRGGRLAYFAVAEVYDVIDDQNNAGHYYALIRNYLEFDSPVPFKVSDKTYEFGLQKEDGSHNKGAFRRAVRNLSDVEFEAILATGFRSDLPDFVPDRNVSEEALAGFREEQAEFVRPFVEVTQLRPFRDRAFSRQVREAYDRRCAFTGLRILNGMGRPEVQAAHIQPVSEDGPDSVRNGLALSSTFHWLFDRGLISLTDDFRILKCRDALSDEVSRFINADGRALVPKEEITRPHPRYLKYHRENVFKG